MIIRVNISTIIDKASMIVSEMEIVFGSNIKIVFPLYIIVATILVILTVFNALTIGHQFQNYKIFASFATFFVLYLITQVILLTLGIVYLLITFGSFSNIPLEADIVPGGAGLFSIISLVLMVISIAHYLSINYFLKNRLNLE